MTEHAFNTEPNPNDSQPWYKRSVRPVCSCGWRADGYYMPGQERAPWATHVRIADLEEHERRVAAGELCAICEEREVGKPLCRTNHCEDNRCVRNCRWCMDELRDERD